MSTPVATFSTSPATASSGAAKAPREHDPRITVIRVTPTDGYYWDTKHGNAVAGVKMLIGAAIGKTLDDSIEGELHF